MPTESILYGRQHHGACPSCQRDLEDAEAGQLVCGHVVCEACLVALAGLEPRQDLWCPQCRTGIDRDQIWGAGGEVSGSEEVRPELSGLTRDMSDPMQAIFNFDLAADEREIYKRAMEGLAESAR
jgi:hypothetical protein